MFRRIMGAFFLGGIILIVAPLTGITLRSFSDASMGETVKGGIILVTISIIYFLINRTDWGEEFFDNFDAIFTIIAFVAFVGIMIYSIITEVL